MGESHDAGMPSGMPDSPTIQVPPGAEDLYPNNIGPKIFAIRDKNQILKAGQTVQLSEAEAMRFVACNTRIPVPEVQACYVEDGIGYIFMTRLEGEPLGEVWEHLGKAQRDTAVAQLRTYMQELSSLLGTFYGSLWRQRCEDIFFVHLPFQPGKISYGPYYSRADYNRGLLQALANSRPAAAPDDSEELAQKLLDIDDDTMVFSHGDLQPMNILVDKSTGRVTGIIDWEAAGFSIRGRDYFEARTRARRDTWLNALEEVFSSQERVHFDLLQDLDQTLTRYTFV